ncbi:hypothetical protein FRC00_005896, partial [Tulasnella sp. 408]
MQRYRKEETRGYYWRLAELSKVCARWYKVVRSSPTLWTVITSAEPKNVIALALERSSNLPLDIVYVDKGIITDWHGLSSFAAYLQTHLSRSKSLDIWALDSAAPIIEIVRHPMPLLEDLKLIDPSATWETPVQLFQDKAPRLRDITLEGITCRWDGDSFHRLNTLSISWVPFPSTATVLNIISNAPQLRKLEIHRCIVTTADAPLLPHIAAPCLSFLYLDLTQPEIVHIIAKHIRTGKRCSFRTYLLTSSGLNCVTQTIKDWVQKAEVKTLAASEGITIDVSTDGVRVELYFADDSLPFSLQVDVMSPTDQIVPLLACFNDLLSPFNGSTTTRLKLSRLTHLDDARREFFIKELFKSPPITIVELGREDDLDFWHALLTESARSRGSSVFAQLRNFSVPTTWKGVEIHEAVLTVVKATNEILQDWSGMGLERVEIRLSEFPDRKDTEALSDWGKRLENIVGIRNAL